MKTYVFLFMALLIASGTNLFAQSVKEPNRHKTPQEVANLLTTNPNAIILTGKVIDIVNHHAITNGEISLSGAGKELIDATVDHNGIYAIALDKSELRFPIHVKIRIEGYKKFIIKDLMPTSDVIYSDILLTPEQDVYYHDEPSKKILMTDDPFTKLIIQY